MKKLDSETGFWIFAAVVLAVICAIGAWQTKTVLQESKTPQYEVRFWWPKDATHSMVDFRNGRATQGAYVIQLKQYKESFAHNHHDVFVDEDGACYLTHQGSAKYFTRGGFPYRPRGTVITGAVVEDGIFRARLKPAGWVAIAVDVALGMIEWSFVSLLGVIVIAIVCFVLWWQWHD